MPQKESDLIPRMIAYLRAHLHDAAPTTEEPPIWWKNESPQAPDGSANIRWLARACWLLWQPAEALESCIAEYQRELQIGHRGFEEMTVSHDGQWLGAHYAIRTWCRGGDPGGTLSNLNTAWCGAEIALMREFYLPEIGVLCPAARFEGVLVSPQRSVIAAWDAGRWAGKNTLGIRPKKAFNDTFCLELAADLATAGDDLGRSAAKLPTLAFPLFVELKSESIRAYWNPGHNVLKPVYYVTWPWTGSQGGANEVFQTNGLPKGKPAMGLMGPPTISGGDFKQIG